MRLSPCVLLLIAASGPMPLAAQPEAAPSEALSAADEVFADDRVDDAVADGAAFLLSRQRGTGAISDTGHETAMTALSLMALASIGHQPADPTPEGEAMQRALAFVLQEDRVEKNGYFGRRDNSRMYGHGIVTLMLTELLGMGTDDEQDRLIHDRCQAGIDLILAAQDVPKDARRQGGWRYEPTSRDSDLSVSVWQVMALRSARNDGLQVPAESIERAVAYLRRSYASPLGQDGRPQREVAGFTYEPGGSRGSFAMTAAGLLAMQVCGEYESPLVAGASDWLLAHPPKWNDRYAAYGLYYYAQGMHQRGGEPAAVAAREVRDILLQAQAGDGSWQAGNGSERGHGRVYATTLAMLSLSVKFHHLPIYQR